MVPEGWSVQKLNDQHAYLHITSDTQGLRVGDRVCLGISHPCTTFDKWRWMPVVDADYSVVDAIVCAAAEAIDVTPKAIRPALLAAFRRARVIGLGVDAVANALEAADTAARASEAQAATEAATAAAASDYSREASKNKSPVRVDPGAPRSSRG